MNSVNVDLRHPAACNIPGQDGASQGTLSFSIADGAPVNGEFFFARYEFSVAAGGLYRLVVCGAPPGTARSSRYSAAIDGGSEFPVLRSQVVGIPTEHAQRVVKMAQGRHTLELRFRRDGRMRAMNRVGQPFTGHRVEITAIRFDPAKDAEIPGRGEPVADEMQIRAGDRIVLFGDSITEEEHYGRHFARILNRLSPGKTVTVYNAGVSLNRVWEGLERVERDVLSLSPAWVVLAFGVNDSVHMSPEEFGRNYEKLVRLLRRGGVQVVCASPTGMSPDPDGSGKWFHTPDRALGFDRTMAYESAEIARVASLHGCVLADVYGFFTRSGLERRSLMANQWHPNDRGGRAYALGLLRSLGAAESAIERTGDPEDLDVWRAIQTVGNPDYPALRVKKFVRKTMSGTVIAVSSFSRNAICFFDEGGGPAACVPVGHHPIGLAWSRERREIYAACGGSGTIEVIGIDDFRQRKPIELGPETYPVALALCPDKETLWSANFFAMSLFETDIRERMVRRTVPLGALGVGVALAADGRTLVALAGEEAVFVDTAGGTVLKREKACEYPGGFQQDGRGGLDIIDTVRWTLHSVEAAERRVEQTSERRAPHRSRAVCRLPGGGWVSGDWERGCVRRWSEDFSENEVIAEIECPLGVLAIER